MSGSPTSYSEAAMKVAREAAVVLPPGNGSGEDRHWYVADVWYLGHHVTARGPSPEQAMVNLATRLSDFKGLTSPGTGVLGTAAPGGAPGGDR